MIAAVLAAACAMAPADRGWIDHAIAIRAVAERRLLKLPATPPPTIIAIDARCTWSRTARGWRGTPHGPTITLPAGVPQPLGPISFAAPYPGSTRGFFAMGLPSVWRAAGVSSDLGLEKLMDGVLLHESMHARQFYFVNPTMKALEARWHLSPDIGDDSVQDAFKGDPAYVAAYEAERDTLFAAAAAPDDAAARRLAGEALALMRTRRARFFSGPAAKWLPLDDLFVQMEGIGQWLAYAWYTAPFGARLPRETALPAVRRGGRYWTQDEGLALMLVVDRLVPGWQRLAFAPRDPLLAEALLARAAGVSVPPRR